MNRLQDTSPKNSAVQKCLRIFPTGYDFLSAFNPTRQIVYTSDERKCYLGNAPALGTVRKAFGDNVAETWLEIQLKDLSEYSGCRDKLNDAQNAEIARIILHEFGYMTVTQMMHFFVRFKAGYYGRFYGSVDGLVITEAIHSFARERVIILSKLEREITASDEEEKRRAAHEVSVNFVNWRRERHLTIADCAFYWEMGLDMEDIDAVYWLFRL